MNWGNIMDLAKINNWSVQDTHISKTKDIDSNGVPVYMVKVSVINKVTGDVREFDPVLVSDKKFLKQYFLFMGFVSNILIGKDDWFDITDIAKAEVES